MAGTATVTRVSDVTDETGGTGLNRWWRVFGGLMMNIALGTLYAWSVFVAPLEKEFGWKRADTSMVFTIAVVVFALTFVVAGRLQDKFGPFWVSLAGAILVSLGFFLCSFTHSLTYLFICFGVIGGLGNGFGYATPIPVMAKWFPDKRGLAIGLAVGGYGAGSALFGPLANLKLIPAYGVHTTFQILGAIFIVMTTIGAFLLKNPPAGYKPAGWTPAPVTAKTGSTMLEFTPSQVLQTPAFYFMWVAYALGTSAGLMVISQLVPFAKSVHISSAALATMTLVVGAAGNASGRILSGWMSDTLGRLERSAVDDRLIDGFHADPLHGRRQRSRTLRRGVRRLLVLRHAAFGECGGHRRLLRCKERRHELRHAVYRLGRSRCHRSQDRWRAVRQVQELPDGFLHGCGTGRSSPGIRTHGASSQARIGGPGRHK